MDNQEIWNEIKKTLDASQSVFVLLPENPSFDATAAALSLFLSLREAGKSILIGAPTKMRVEFKNLVGLDRVTERIGNRNLIISFDYAEEAIEKVSYNVEDGKFNLVIEPKSGHPPLDSQRVSFSYEGIEANTIFVIGARRLEDLSHLYEKDRTAINRATIVNIDNRTANTNFGRHNLIIPSAAAVSEIIFQLLRKLNLPLDIDIAGNLLTGIEAQTQNLQSPFTGPETFEAVATLMRSGAKRSSTPPHPLRQFMPRPPTTPGLTQEMLMRRATVPPQPTAPFPPTQFAEPKLEMTVPAQSTEPAIQPEAPKSEAVQQPAPQPSGEATAPPTAGVAGGAGTGRDIKREDWHKPPPIYKGSTKV